LKWGPRYVPVHWTNFCLSSANPRYPINLLSPSVPGRGNVTFVTDVVTIAAPTPTRPTLLRDSHGRTLFPRHRSGQGKRISIVEGYVPSSLNSVGTIFSPPIPAHPRPCRYHLPRPCGNDIVFEITCRALLQRLVFQFVRQSSLSFTVIHSIYQAHRGCPLASPRVLQSRSRALRCRLRGKCNRCNQDGDARLPRQRQQIRTTGATWLLVWLPQRCAYQLGWRPTSCLWWLKMLQV
jgi:hypothetical protein